MVLVPPGEIVMTCRMCFVWFVNVCFTYMYLDFLFPFCVADWLLRLWVFDTGHPFLAPLFLLDRLFSCKYKMIVTENYIEVEKKEIIS